MQSKGLCTEREWRGWCSEVVPLLIAPKFCFTNKEGLHAIIQVANYSGTSLKGKTLSWNLDGKQGIMTLPQGEGLINVGALDVDLSDYNQATQLKLVLQVEGTDYRNSYNLWVYPFGVDLSKLEQKVIVTNELTDRIAQQLENGKSVLLMPDSSKLTVGGLFQTDYWNYRMFKTISENNKKMVSPGTLGILTDPRHPIFNSFPTEMHTNWQWFPIIKASHPFILDNTGKDYRPIVQVIDNIERNHKLGLVFEFAVGKGKLLVCMADLDTASAGRQFYRSVLEYMTSNDFAPTTSISLEDFRKLMTMDVVEGKIGELNNISPY